MGGQQLALIGPGSEFIHGGAPSVGQHEGFVKLRGSIARVGRDVGCHA